MGTRRRRALAGGKRIKGNIQNFNSFSHDIMNKKTFDAAQQWYQFGKQVSNFFK